MGNLIRIVAAIFLPPLGVFLTVGIGTDFWINLVLTFFLYSRHHSRCLGDC
jgi:uncharacterized membrane protein YqaE (UPF0057 family)